MLTSQTPPSYVEWTLSGAQQGKPILESYSVKFQADIIALQTTISFVDLWS